MTDFKNLSDLFIVPDNYEVSHSDYKYFGSLTPQWNVLKEINKVQFAIDLKHVTTGTNILKNQNPVNSHIFKPRYYLDQTKKTLICKVPSKDVLIHTAKALTVASYINNISNLPIETIDEKENIIDFASHWIINDKVLIGRVESILHYLKILWLREKEISEKTIVEYILEEEQSRIRAKNSFYEYRLNKELKKKKLTWSDFENHFSICHQKTDSPYFDSFNMVYEGLNITVIQLTWGYSLSYELIDLIKSKQPELKEIIVVGGVGYTKNGDINIDDVFIPTEVVLRDQDSVKMAKLDNICLNAPENIHFNLKNKITGPLASLKPEAQKFHYSVELEPFRNDVVAVDMEMEGFYKSLQKNYESKNVTIGAIFYIMDKPSIGMGLGNTYYDYDFLEKLYSNYQRGKMYCYEVAFNTFLIHKNA